MRKTGQNKLNYWPELKVEVDKILLQDPSVKEGKMFGYPAYYVNGKLAICHYDIGLALKLPTGAVQNLHNSRIVSEPFCPMGKKMGNNWAIIFPKNPKEIHEVTEILFESVKFLQQTKIKQKANTTKKKNGL